MEVKASATRVSVLARHSSSRRSLSATARLLTKRRRADIVVCLWAPRTTRMQLGNNKQKKAVFRRRSLRWTCPRRCARMHRGRVWWSCLLSLCAVGEKPRSSHAPASVASPHRSLAVGGDAPTNHHLKRETGSWLPRRLRRRRPATLCTVRRARARASADVTVELESAHRVPMSRLCCLYPRESEFCRLIHWVRYLIPTSHRVADSNRPASPRHEPVPPLGRPTLNLAATLRNRTHTISYLVLRLVLVFVPSLHSPRYVCANTRASLRRCARTPSPCPAPIQ